MGSTTNRISFGIALFIVLTMVIPAPSTMFASLIQPSSNILKSNSFPPSLFSAQYAAADYQSQFGTAGSGNGQFSAPLGIAMDSSNNIYVVDSGNNRVEKFNSAGVYQSQFGSSGSGNGQFSAPRGITIDSSGNIYVVDTNNNRVEEFNSAGVYQSQFGSSGSGNGQFNNPHGITIDSSGNIYVSDSNNNRVQKFNSAGVYQSQFGSSGSGNGQFSGPGSPQLGITLDSSGNIYVVDTGNNRVEKFSHFASYISQFGSF